MAANLYKGKIDNSLNIEEKIFFENQKGKDKKTTIKNGVKEIDTEGKTTEEILLELGYVPKFVTRVSDGVEFGLNNDGTYSIILKTKPCHVSCAYIYDSHYKLSDPKFFNVTTWILPSN